MKLLVTCILPFLFLLATTPHAAEPGSIGYVDMQVVLDKSKMGQEAHASLEEKFAGRENKLTEEEQSILRMQNTLNRDQALMSEEELDKKKAEIQGRIGKLRQEAAKAQQELAAEQQKLGKAILEPAGATIEAVAKDKGVTAVFERRQSGLLYIDEGLDLTAEVVKRLDAQQKN